MVGWTFRFMAKCCSTFSSRSYCRTPCLAPKGKHSTCK